MSRIIRGNSCYQITYGPRFVHVVAIKGIAWDDNDRHDRSFTIPNDELRPTEEWEAHSAVSTPED